MSNEWHIRVTNSDRSGCRLRELNSFLLQKYSSAYIGQWCPNGLDGKNQGVECHQQKIDQRLNGVRSSLKEFFLYKMNQTGPRTEPCGTPKQKMDGFELFLSDHYPFEQCMGNTSNSFD